MSWEPENIEQSTLSNHISVRRQLLHLRYSPAKALWWAFYLAELTHSLSHELPQVFFFFVSSWKLKLDYDPKTVCSTKYIKNAYVRNKLKQMQGNN